MLEITVHTVFHQTSHTTKTTASKFDYHGSLTSLLMLFSCYFTFLSTQGKLRLLPEAQDARGPGPLEELNIEIIEETWVALSTALRWWWGEGYEADALPLPRGFQHPGRPRSDESGISIRFYTLWYCTLGASHQGTYISVLQIRYFTSRASGMRWIGFSCIYLSFLMSLNHSLLAYASCCILLVC
jgi:hypothetical protein